METFCSRDDVEMRFVFFFCLTKLIFFPQKALHLAEICVASDKSGTAVFLTKQKQFHHFVSDLSQLSTVVCEKIAH